LRGGGATPNLSAWFLSRINTRTLGMAAYIRKCDSTPDQK
jgi:hypothetical protein